jgi:hypothetical protein
MMVRIFVASSFLLAAFVAALLGSQLAAGLVWLAIISFVGVLRVLRVIVALFTLTLGIVGSAMPSR